VREALEDESYQAFMQREAVAVEETAVPRPVASTVRRLLSTADFGNLTAGNHAVSERLAHEAVSWCDSRWAETRKTAEQTGPDILMRCRTLAEARLHLPPATRKVHELARSILGAAVPPGGAAEPDRRGSVPGAGVDGTRDSVEARARISFIADLWRAEIESERETEQTRTLGRALGTFVRELAAVLPVLLGAQEVVRDLFGSEHALWDSSMGDWTITNWDSLTAFARVLEKHPELDRLAEILGRSRVNTTEVLRTDVVREIATRAIGLGKSEVTGFTFGDDLSSLIPSEIALLSNPDTEELFYAKLAHRELLQFDYRRERIVREMRERRVSRAERIVVARGPIVLCIDTSGSMMGEPETVAKAMTLALCRRLESDGRSIHIIAFSTDTRSFRVVPGRLRLADLAAFLSSGFRGGTDLRPALEEALGQLETEEFTNADVLVVSDFRVPKIADRFIARIKRQQGFGTLFHSLTIARGAVRDPMHIFDRSWLFDLTGGVRGIRPETLRPIA